MKTIQLIFVAAISLLMLFSCGSRNDEQIINQNIKLDDIEWKRSDVLHYEFEISDTSCPYNLLFNIRHANMYPFANVLFNLRLESPSGSTRVKDFEVFLRNSDGEFLGDGMGDYWDFEVNEMQGVYFSEPGIWKADVEHYMPMDIVPGIMEFGFIVEKSDQVIEKNN